MKDEEEVRGKNFLGATFLQKKCALRSFIHRAEPDEPQRLFYTNLSKPMGQTAIQSKQW